MKRVALLGLVLGCGKVAETNVDATMSSDSGGGADSASAARCDPLKPFGTPTKLANVNSAADDITPSVTADELQLWFSSRRAGGPGAFDIYMATRTSPTADFDSPALVAGVNSAGGETRPVVPGPRDDPDPATIDHVIRRIRDHLDRDQRMRAAQLGRRPSPERVRTSRRSHRGTLGSGECCAATGWQIDDIAMTGITNTPFPAFVPEPTTCAASSAASESEAGVTSLRSMRRMSLDGVAGAAEP